MISGLITAHKWFNLASVRGNADAIRLRREIADQMSEIEIASAQRAARDWLERALRRHAVPGPRAQPGPGVDLRPGRVASSFGDVKVRYADRVVIAGAGRGCASRVEPCLAPASAFEFMKRTAA